ncbi:MBL fold metallo-hydrolase RNA specificity domain-containing protein [Ectothiorhodospira lacustris]|uniref:MBL fold metallo-hydrolase RNA specificity domain-containing protein n=1 Tax=Ectothiorhodospira lacustris TaxID=2899127 RepID=UPI001EE7D339|nr:MBL fold metallo-hydrolase [Ectothiorhodospira lacustris]MCG5501446.1 MBL fold metallo-hydrolase [Ectothiorhodospira lacustris]MCG5509888.1 MBL fold metallo-hydrolase [Ectothiorhodospira lacustris]MCG5521141.1 MBL fold metallo-hydrolase [Ectothiorhodospira lacustris]
MSKLTFLGATGEVTGSRYLLETQQSRLLLECGIQQGGAEADKANRRSLGHLAKTVDAVVISHGHLDHAGLLPKLVRDGFQGPIYCTDSTLELLGIMLRDAAHVMSKDIEWENKWRERADKPLIEPVYTQEDVDATLILCRPLPYGRAESVTPDIHLTFRDAGHILGSAIVDLIVDDGGRKRHLVFSGDLGNPDSALMHAPTQPEHADVVLMESTYGDRDHRPLGDTLEELARILTQADRDGGNVLIPAFAVGRTQEILYHLGMLYHEGRLPQQKVFLDSPMGIQVTELYARRRGALNGKDLKQLRQASGERLEASLPILQFTRRMDESMAINRIKSGAIIIAGAGMCTGGRIRHHLKYNLWRKQNHVVIVGFQARGSLGRMLVDGVQRVKLLGSEVAVKAQIHTLGGFSAHAGQRQLVAWAKGFKDKPVFYMVHGEPRARDALANLLRQEHGIDARVPAYEETITL